ncbi:hypothetical protein DFP72DRAFT_21253 [Ephemerocybe angulata]|uniref:lipoyl(octanoyl) transferase n=1 Tax=Ephemerocybe angulata TaxID=980116 RepID=A0A8H6MF61_9AGAR|nr:hypothetical protein DFP72DRAFT_21253 [Tulosesus angulatus]
MALPPIFYHAFRPPLPYRPTWLLQESLHRIQLEARRSANHNDLLLLLEHRPVYTAGRRQTEHELDNDRQRLTAIGADFVSASRGGQLTYHGPGQIVGYPLLDLSRYSPVIGARDYVCRMQKTLELHLKEAHGLDLAPSEHTGVFLDPRTKIASIGVQVRHRLTSHGFALNVTHEPRPWFDEVVACGLDGVKAGSIQSATGKPVTVQGEIPGLVERFGRLYGRDMVRLDLSQRNPSTDAILALEQEAAEMGPWAKAPRK